MVGDGVNDATAMVTADVGIATARGRRRVEAGEIVLVRKRPRDVPRIIGVVPATDRKMSQNLWWRRATTSWRFPLAAGLLAGVRFVLSTAMGAALMSASTIVVAIQCPAAAGARGYEKPLIRNRVHHVRIEHLAMAPLGIEGRNPA